MATPDTDIERAREALARGAWAEAYDGFTHAEPSRMTPRDLEGLADAAWWISRFPESLDARQRAYAAYAEGGDETAAAGVAARLAIEHFVRDEPSVGAGFLMRARRHAQDLPEGREVGFLAMVEANVSRFSGDLDGAVASARRATAIGQRIGDRDLVAMAIHTEGLTLIAAGRVHEGLALLDEAMTSVLAGGLSPYFTGIIYCDLIAACLELSDIRRAGEWSDAAIAWCETLRPDAPFTAMCRVNRAEVARLRGAWAEAETEAALASQELETIEPGVAASAYVQLGEIRRRIGDIRGADDAFTRAHQLGADPQPGLALLELARGRLDAARAGLRSALAAEHHPARRTRLLSSQVEVALAAGDTAEASAACEELARIAAAADTAALRASAATAEGALRLATSDAASALGVLRVAVDSWQALGTPYETAKARVLLGLAIRATGDEDGARRELGVAASAFERLGAAPDAAATRRLLEGPERSPGGLTAREAEVLRLVAAGKTNRDIAVELVISEHTVARHLQNMFAKLGVASRAAATAYAYEHGLA